jgi:hypothetical protein
VTRSAANVPASTTCTPTAASNQAGAIRELGQHGDRGQESQYGKASDNGDVERVRGGQPTGRDHDQPG